MAQPESQLLELMLEPPLEHGPFIVQSAPRIRHRLVGTSKWSPTVHTSNADFRDTNAWLNGLQDAPVGGRRLIDHVRHDEVGMWQFLPSYVWPEVFWAVELVKALDGLMEVTELHRVLPLPSDSALDGLWQAVVAAFAETRGLTVDAPTAGAPNSVSRARRLARAAGLGHARARLTEAGGLIGARALTLATRSGAHDARSPGRRLLLVSMPRDWRPAPEGHGPRTDVQFGPLLGALRAAGWEEVVGVECPYGPKLEALRSTADRIRHDGTGVTWRPFESYRSARRGARSVEASCFREQWRSITRDAMDSPSAHFRGVPLLRALAPTFAHAFSSTLPECAVMRATARAILAAEKPTAIIATYETGPYQRALMIEGARVGIPMVGLMHGMIFDNHYDYMHERVGVDPISPATAFAIPSRTCVWGPAWKRSLTQAGHYPPETVTVGATACVGPGATA